MCCIGLPPFLGGRAGQRKLKRNVGHQHAIALGIRLILEKINEKHKIIIMDSDGEDLPNSAKLLIKELDSEEIDVVVAYGLAQHRKNFPHLY